MANVTAYIFKEDRDKLVREAGGSGRGGSLFGQWTSTGNPVVHVAISSAQSQSETNRTAKELSNNFKLCHIGEWRPVSYNDSYGRKPLLSKYRDKQEAPSRFLVLDVSRAQILPYLFIKAQERAGKLEILEGQNPFNIALRNPPAYQSYQRPAAAASQGQRNPGHVRSQSHEAETSSIQWYAHDNGNQDLQFVHQALQNIAQSRHVEMSRDTNTHDMSMIFTDQLNGNRWEVKFPYNFPRDGAKLIATSSSPNIIGQSNQRNMKEPDNHDVQKAVERMVSVIRAFRS